jgi:hypothetical protein
LVGDQLEQHQLQLAGVEDAPRPAASFAMLAVAAEAMATAMAEMTVARAAMIAGKLERLGLVRSGVTGPPAEASAVVAVVAAPVAPAPSAILQPATTRETGANNLRSKCDY